MMVHKEVEKRRRQEMASLHASLRSLLPLEYLKRSISDHLDKAVKYVNHLKARNERLRNIKEQLRARENNNHCQSNDSCRRSDRVVIVNACKEGRVDIVLKVGQEDNLPMSVLLKALAHQGLDITNFICRSMGHDVWLHCLQAQVREGIGVDASKLQHQLCLEMSDPG